MHGNVGAQCICENAWHAWINVALLIEAVCGGAGGLLHGQHDLGARQRVTLGTWATTGGTSSGAWFCIYIHILVFIYIHIWYN